MSHALCLDTSQYASGKTMQKLTLQGIFTRGVMPEINN